MIEAGRIVKETLFLNGKNIKPGISTIELDRIAEDYIRSQNATPGFKVSMITLQLYVYLLKMRWCMDFQVIKNLNKGR